MYIYIGRILELSQNLSKKTISFTLIHKNYYHYPALRIQMVPNPVEVEEVVVVEEVVEADLEVAGEAVEVVEVLLVEAVGVVEALVAEAVEVVEALVVEEEVGEVEGVTKLDQFLYVFNINVSSSSSYMMLPYSFSHQILEFEGPQYLITSFRNHKISICLGLKIIKCMNM